MRRSYTTRSCDKVELAVVSDEEPAVDADIDVEAVEDGGMEVDGDTDVDGAVDVAAVDVEADEDVKMFVSADVVGGWELFCAEVFGTLDCVCRCRPVP